MLAPASTLSLRGVVQNGQQPIANATLQLYAAGAAGDGSSSQALLSQPVTSADDGRFSISSAVACPSPTSQLYLVATGGSPSPNSGSSNAAIALMTTLGPCNELGASSGVMISEVTTIASLWPLAPYATSYTQIGFGNVDSQSFDAAVQNVHELITLPMGTTLGPMLTSGNVVPTAKLNSLASIVAACVGSSGGSASDGTACGRLFAAATVEGAAPPTDTIAAALLIAKHPTRNVDVIYALTPPSSTYNPVLSAAPNDWTLPILPVPATPTISPNTDSLAEGQTVAIANATSGATIFYTVDGSVPTATSQPYTAPLSIAGSQVINAIAIKDGISSPVASRSFRMHPRVSVALTPGQVNLSASATQGFTAAVSGSTNTAVTWSMSPAMGSLSAAGVYAAPASILSQQAITVTATSVADATKSASATLTLTPTVSVALSPGSVTLGPSRTQMFAALVAGTSNTGVRWSVSPATGSISAAGLYTAPVSITKTETLTVTASSLADPAKSASANLVLSPSVSVALNPGRASLMPSTTQEFTTIISGALNTGVKWSLSPAIGSISTSGVYTAPATVASQQTVLVTAASVADPSKSATANLTVMPAVHVRLSPERVTLAPSNTQDFAAIVKGTSNKELKWSLNPTVGDLSDAGMYTAPASIGSQQTVTVTATSVADPTKSATANLTLMPGVSVALTPGTVTLGASLSQAFTATVGGSSNTGVNWSLSPAVGSISAAGVYVAPPLIATQQTVTVTATSAADSTKAASAILTLTPSLSVALSPGSVTLGPLKTQAFTATVLNSTNPAVSWSLKPAIGTISAAGLYTAPASISAPQTVVVTATSAADSTKSMSASVNLAPPVSVSVSPGTVTLGPSSTQAFTAAVAGTTNTAVTWSMSPAVGSISATGVYTAPSAITSQQTVTVTAASVADPSKSASVSISLTPPVSVTVSPGSVSLGASSTQTFTATVAGGTNTAVTWSMSPAWGSISAAGVYTSPASVTSQQIVTVIATSAADPTKSASASLTLTPSVSVGLSPGNVVLGPSGTQIFTALVSGTSNIGVTWSMSPAVGSLSTAGVYTAPASVTSLQMLVVTATSTADPSKSTSASITLAPPVSVVLSPGSMTLGPSGVQAFTALVAGSSNTGVTWSLNPAVGSISAAGQYTAPASIALQQTVTVTATSVADPSKSGSASLTLMPVVSVLLSPGSATLSPSQTEALAVTVSGSANSSVSWTISPAVGTISAAGVYTAPASILSQQTVIVTATSVADASKWASATLTLVPVVSVSLSPGSVTLGASKTQSFSATVGGSSNTGVTWTVVPAVGTISLGVYTAPAAITSEQTVTVITTSVADSTKSASASVTLVPTVSVALSPGNVSLAPAQTRTFVATIAGSANTAVTWAMSPALGSISATGVYTAPVSIASQQTVTVTATSVADPTKSASASVTLTPPVSLALSPASITLGEGSAQAFTATVSGTTNTGVTWSMSPSVGSISVAGMYTAPASIVSQQIVSITATSVADSTKSATASVTLVPPVNVVVSPGTATLAPLGTQAFLASVAGTSNTGVTWSLSPAVGTISAAGVYVAPASIASQQIIAVKATSLADPTRSASATLTLISPVNVAVNPGSVTLTASKIQAFTASVTGSSNPSVTWTLNPAVGSISAAGVYTAPATITAQQTVTVTASSVADSTKSASASVTLAPPAQPAVTLSLPSVTINADSTLTGVVTLTQPAGAAGVSVQVASSATGFVTVLPATVKIAAGATSASFTYSGVASGVATLTASTPGITAAVVSVAVSQPSSSAYSGPLTITKGGTYTGRWQSTDPTVPAVTVNTDQPVILLNSVLRGPGKLIWANGGGPTGIHLQVTNVLGIGVNPNIAGKAKGDFMTVSGGTSIEVDHSTMVGLNGGIVIVTSRLSYLKLSNNQAVNMDDRASDGNGGMQATRPAYGHTILLSDVSLPNGADISYNQFINQQGLASVEDIISIYNSQGGSVSLPIHIHDNYIQGAVTNAGQGYTGGGIITDGQSSATEAVPAYVNINNNQVVQTENYGLAIAGGHDVIIQNNRVVSSGKNSAGAWLGIPGYGNPVAYYLWNFYNDPTFYNNQITNNNGGAVVPNASGNAVRSDMLTTSASATLNDTVTANPLILPLTDATVPSQADEQAEYTSWLAKLVSAAQTVGAPASLQP